MPSWSDAGRQRLRGPLGGATATVASTAAAGLAVVALVVVAARGPQAVVVARWVLSLLWWVVDAVVPHPASERTRVDAAVVVATRLGGRALLVLTTALGAGPTTSVRWGLGLLLLVAVVEPVLTRLRPPADAEHLPGLGAQRSQRPLGVVGLGGVVVTALTGLLAVTDADGAAWVGLGVLHAAVALVAGAAGLRDLLGRRARSAALRAALERHAPELLVYNGRDDGGAHQVAMWLPALERTGRRFAVVTRGPEALAAVAEVTTAPVVSRAAWRDLDDVVVPSARVALYVNAASTNTNFVGYRQLVHVYLGHGESDKALSYHPSHAMFDRVLVAGQAAIERYGRHGIDISLDRFVVVGRPQLGAIAPAGPRPGDDLPVVLYAPTWAGYNAASSHSSLPVAAEVVRGLLSQPVRVLFRPHPFSRRRSAERGWVAEVEQLLAQDAARTGRDHRWGAQVEQGTEFADSANASDVLVADLSSVLVDYLVSGKPMAVVAAGAGARYATDFAARHPVARAAAVVRPDGTDAGQVLAGLLGADELARERAQVRRFYLGGLTAEQSLDAFTAAITSCVELADKRRVDLEDLADVADVGEPG
ncbi:CDP-glycerol glycerophosphotransferase family protein [Angustibacter aerolatus]